MDVVLEFEELTEHARQFLSEHPEALSDYDLAVLQFD